jgi:hypothetical protein
MKMDRIAGKVSIKRFTAGLTLAFVLLISGAVGFNINRKSSFRPAPGSPVETGIGDAPVSLAMGDFNKDGILDLAIANSTDNSVSILLGKGDGTFAPSSGSAFSTGGNPTTAVAVGDFNNDGKLDVVATDLPGGLSGELGDLLGSPGGNISVFLGNGDGTFGGHKDTDGGGDFPGAVAVGDFNGDGKLDVVITNSPLPSPRTLWASRPRFSTRFARQRTCPTRRSPSAWMAKKSGSGTTRLLSMTWAIS